MARPTRGLVAMVSFFTVWVVTWLVILTRLDALPGAPPQPLQFLGGEIVTGLAVVALLWLARREPVPVQEGPVRTARLELAVLLCYLAAVVGLGHWWGLRTHVASVGLHAATAHEWQQQTPLSLVAWAAYYGVFGVLLPLGVMARRRLGSTSNLLLRWRRPHVWVPYAGVTAIVGVVGTADASFYGLPASAYLIAALLFTAGTFLPVMVLTQSLIAPRCALVAGSWPFGAVLAGLVYGAYHSGEFFLAWTTPQDALLSCCWVYQFAYFGVLKAITTLRTGNAWLHIFNSHAPHLGEAAAVADVFGMT